MSAYPVVEPTRVVMPLDLRGWAVFAGRGLTKTTGMVLEGRPGEADHVWLWSTGDEVHAQPHYSFSTWDEFWSDASARINATGFSGLFPFTLGDQKSLRDGFLSILDRAATLLAAAEPQKAQSFRDCATRIRSIPLPPRRSSDRIRAHRARGPPPSRAPRGRRRYPT